MKPINPATLKTYYFLKHFLTTSLLLFFTVSVSNAQTSNTITGKIIEHITKLPLPGATVHIKGSTHEVLTDEDGIFIFKTAQKLPLTFTVSFVGYQTTDQKTQ